MASINTYVSAKKVSQFTENRQKLGEGELTTGIPWVAGLDPDYPALLVGTFTTDGEELRLRLDFSRLVNSLVAAEAAEADRWTDVFPAEREGYYGNAILSAHVQYHSEGIAQISYHRHDRAPIHDWRIGQRLKNQLLGPEWEAVEVYPAESRLVDTVNEYHLFAKNGPIPLGFDYRDVATQDQIDDEDLGAVQRDPEPGTDLSDHDPNAPHFRPLRTPDLPSLRTVAEAIATFENVPPALMDTLRAVLAAEEAA